MKKLLFLGAIICSFLALFTLTLKTTYAEEIPASEPTTSEVVEQEQPLENLILSKDELDSIITAAKSGDIDKVKNLLIGAISTACGVLLLALIYIIKIKLKEYRMNDKFQKILAATSESNQAYINNMFKDYEAKLEKLEAKCITKIEEQNSEKKAEIVARSKAIAESILEASSITEAVAKDIAEE